ncbi:MAG: hypothetical protein FWC26_14130 [Fibromonadales bacterium]|nr:hypothetical protein [Fibromonadales bacterium]
MTDEEMENKMAELGREFAERSVEISNSGKSASMINRELKNLRDEFEYRKAAYANANLFSDTILAYEAEHKLKIPHTTISKSFVV